MGATEIPREAEQSKLATNIMHFARSLRLAGLPIGTDKIIDAVYFFITCMGLGSGSG